MNDNEKQEKITDAAQDIHHLNRIIMFEKRLDRRFGSIPPFKG